MIEPPSQAGGAGYRLVEHTADMGIEAYGGSLAVLFEQAALGLLAVLGAEGGSASEERLLEVTGYEVEEVLVNWLNELLYLLEIQGFLPITFTMESADRQGLTARVGGTTYNPAIHSLEREIKAVTYHQLRVEEADGRWRVRIFVDL